MIAIRRQSTVQTKMPTIFERLANLCATRACLARTSRIHSNKHTSSTFSLVRDHVQELSPASIVDGLCEHSAGESFGIQIFDGYQAVFVDDLSRQLVVKVCTLLADMLVRPLKQYDSLAAPIRAFLATRYAPLSNPQCPMSVAVVARVFDSHAIAQNRKGSQPNVNTNGFIAERKRPGCDFAGEDGKPSSGFALNRQSLRCAIDRLMQLYSDSANFRQLQMSGVGGESVLCIGQGSIARKRLKARISRFFPAIHSEKKTFVSLVRPAQHVLQNLRVDTLRVFSLNLNFPQLGALRIVANAFTFELPSVTPFLKRGVVKLTANRKLSIECFRLPFARIDSVFETAYYLFSQSVNLNDQRFVLRSGSFGVSASFEPFVF